MKQHERLTADRLQDLVRYAEVMSHDLGVRPGEEMVAFVDFIARAIETCDDPDREWRAMRAFLARVDEIEHTPEN